jgi:nucleoside transporter
VDAKIPYIRTRLSTQMFLQFAIWGAWAPVLGAHLGNLGLTGVQIGAVYGTAALATIIAPMIAGQLADRFFSTQKFLSFCYICSGILLYLAAKVGKDDPDKFNKLWWLAFGSFFFFGPSLGLANSLSFSHMRDPRVDFPIVRVFGTIGWIAAGSTLSLWMKLTGRPIGDCLVVGAGFAVLNAFFCLSLPDTPPKREGVELFAAGKALKMLKDPSFALLMILAFVLLVFATMYYTFGSVFFKAVGVADDNLALVMSIGQWAEIAIMFILPFVYRTLGSKLTIAIGVLAWAVRFGLYAIGTPVELIYVAQGMHGICFAFAIAAAMIYVERVCPVDIRASAQSLLGMATYGLGMFTGSYLGGYLVDRATKDTLTNWQQVWTIVSAGCFAVLVVFLLGFRPRDVEERKAEPAPSA